MLSPDITALIILSLIVNLLLIIICTHLFLVGKRIKRKLHDSEERFRSFAENSADVVWQADQELRYCYVNEADQLLRGFHQKEVIGRPVTDFLASAGAEQVVLANRERLLLERQGVKTGARRYEVQQALKDGGYIWTEVHAAPLRDLQGTITGYIGITRDISVTKRNECKQAELLASEQRAREEQERFLSMISHEYRTPLAIIQSNIEILRMKQVNMPGHLETNLAKMQRAVNRLVEILETGRRKGRSATGVHELVLEPVTTSQFLTDIRDEAVDYWGSSRLLFTCHVDEDSVMQADVQLLRTALLNLLDNGIKYSSPTSVVEFESLCDQQTVAFIVHNRSQRAINTEPETLFRKYTRGSNSADIAGTGEGLWLAQQIVKLHDGSITIAVVDFYTVAVTVRLPINQANEVNHAS